MAYGTINVDKMVSSDNVTSGGLYGFKNRIINGAMMIDQRNNGNSFVSTNGYSVDRWSVQGSQASKLTVQQNKGNVSPLPAGFSNYLGVSVSTTATVGAGDYFLVGQPIEGYNIADLGWGSANASAVTLSFKVYSSVTGTFGGVLTNAAQNRSYPFTYSIGSSNTWTTVSITIPGDTSGTWGTTNGTGILLYFGLGVGSTYSGTGGSWAAATYLSATGATNIMATSGATFYITGVQLEKGSTATSFDYRPYGTELALCQRYYAKMNAGTGAYTSFANGTMGSSTIAWVTVKYPTTMRASPTIGQSGTALNDGNVGISFVSLGTLYAGTDSALQVINTGASTQYRSVSWNAGNNTSAYIDFAAEL